jgi:hypothetical protein
LEQRTLELVAAQKALSDPIARRDQAALKLKALEARFNGERDPHLSRLRELGLPYLDALRAEVDYAIDQDRLRGAAYLSPEQYEELGARSRQLVDLRMQLVRLSEALPGDLEKQVAKLRSQFEAIVKG